MAVHYCTGSGPAFFSGTQFASLADQFKFIVIYPSATRSGNCFDVSSPGALRHNGNSDPVGIVSMVNWVVQNRNGDANRVYVTGASSGGMMTNVLLGDYPDVFKAGAAFMGVPFGCFATTDGSMWNSQCSSGQRIMTPQQWGDLVRNAFPGYTGPRPRMQVFHGTTDTTLAYPNFGEEIKQWTNVLGVSQTPVVHRHAAVRLDPHPLRRHRNHGAGRGRQRRQRRAQPAAGRSGRHGDRVLRAERQPADLRRTTLRRHRPAPAHHTASHHAASDHPAAGGRVPA